MDGGHGGGHGELHHATRVAVPRVIHQVTLVIKLIMIIITQKFLSKKNLAFPLLQTVTVYGWISGYLDSTDLDMILMTRLYLNSSVAEERKLTRIADVHLEGVPVGVDGGGTGDVGVGVHHDLQAHVKPHLALQYFPTFNGEISLHPLLQF